MADHIDVFISSTSRDLLEYREAVKESILSWNMYPIDMADFNASDSNALQVCYDKVQEAEVFIGIYAHRYGYAPDAEVTYTKKDGTVGRGDGVTGITHWEYVWAKERGIPMLFYVVDEEMDWKTKFVDDDRKPLKTFKEMIGKHHVWGTFTTSDNLGIQVSTGLAEWMGKNKINVGEGVLETFNDYRLDRIKEWSQPRYQIDKRFVNLTLMIDQGEEADKRWTVEERRFTELGEVFAKRVDDKAFVLLGAPGSGKSTLLRHLQLDMSRKAVESGDDHTVTFFIQLNSYRPSEGTPQQWLKTQWKERYPKLSALDTLLSEGRMFLMLDAVNEMPHTSIAHYHELVGMWREFTRRVVEMGNRVIYSCRTLDYGAVLSSKDLPVPQIDIQNMNDGQVKEFLGAYLPAQAERVWEELKGASHLDLFRTPYFLKLLCDQVETYQSIPKDRAALFTGFVRRVLKREIEGENKLFKPNGLLTDRDHMKISQEMWRDDYELPEQGLILNKIAWLAYTMQEKGLSTETAQVRIQYDAACDLLKHERDADILKAGVALNVLDEELQKSEILFFHQLLQEFFAARQLAKYPKAGLVSSAWQVDEVKPSLEEVLESLPSNDPLPSLPQTGWEETTLLATLMTEKPMDFVREISAVNLPLAGRCAVSLGENCPGELKAELQQALIGRTQDEKADVRARIAAGLALGLLGDPRFERKKGKYGEYLMPPLVRIEGGEYPMGVEGSDYQSERPAHTVKLEAYELGQFPVTNAEYRLFMEAGGYEEERWWETEEAQAWRRGEGSSEGSKQQFRETYEVLQGMSDAQLQAMVPARFTSEQAEVMIHVKHLSRSELEAMLEEQYPSGVIYREPRYWEDSNYNNPSQPVVGVSWYEARAYCKWLSAQMGREIDLPSEAQFEAAARGKSGRMYPYGMRFDVSKGNTFESHIRRTTPVGIFGNGTPEGIMDLSGNAYTWTLSVYDLEQFAYPYRADDGRENIRSSGKRVLRGGSFSGDQFDARSVYRGYHNPNSGGSSYGFRVCCCPHLLRL